MSFDLKQLLHKSNLTLLSCMAFVMFLQFHKLGQLAIVQWDESRLAVNAAEMSRSGNLLVTTFKGEPDLYNTKPPLMIWLQAASIRLFGPDEFAIRFPSALAGFICILFCGYIVYQYRRNSYHACFAIVLLACSKGFIQLHGSITGDYDALLALWLLLAFYHFYNGFIRSPQLHSRLWFLLFLSLAVMTKSAAACIASPGFVIAAAIQRDWRKTGSAFLFCLLSTLPFVLYALLRDMASPNYLRAIHGNDFGGRFSQAIEGHTSEWHYYIVNLFDYRFNLLIWLLPLALIIPMFKKDLFHRYYSIIFCLYFLLISAARTRIHWYDTPILPVAAILITLLLINVWEWIKTPWLKTAFVALVVLSLIIPVWEKYEFIEERKGMLLSWDYYELSNFLRTHEGQEELLYLSKEYDPEFYFYTLKDQRIKRGELRQLKAGQLVATGNHLADSVKKYYDVQAVDSTLNARKMRIVAVKGTP